MAVDPVGLTRRVDNLAGAIDRDGNGLECGTGDGMLGISQRPGARAQWNSSMVMRSRSDPPVVVAGSVASAVRERQGGERGAGSGCGDFWGEHGHRCRGQKRGLPRRGRRRRQGATRSAGRVPVFVGVTVWERYPLAAWRNRKKMAAAMREGRAHPGGSLDGPNGRSSILG